MRGYRPKGDLVLVIPTQSAEDGKMMLLTLPGQAVYVIKLLPRYQLLLQLRQAKRNRVAAMADVRVIGKCAPGSGTVKYPP